MQILKNIAQNIFQSQIEFEDNPYESSAYKFLENKLEIISPVPTLPFDYYAFQIAMEEIYYAILNSEEGKQWFIDKAEMMYKIKDFNVEEINAVIKYFEILFNTTFYVDGDYLIDEAHNKECLSIENCATMLVSIIYLVYEKYKALICVKLLNMTKEEWIGCLDYSRIDEDAIKSNLNNIKNTLMKNIK